MNDALSFVTDAWKIVIIIVLVGILFKFLWKNK